MAPAKEANRGQSGVAEAVEAAALIVLLVAERVEVRRHLAPVLAPRPFA